VKRNESNNKKRFENYEDSLWQVIMFNYAKHDGKKLSEENEALKTDPQAQPSDAERKKYHKLLDKELRKNKIRSFTKMSKKILSRAAVFVFVLIIGFAIMFTTVSAFRVQVLNFLISFEDEYVGIKLGDNDNSDAITLNWHDVYLPSYIPDGYQINQIANMDIAKTIDYINAEGNFIKYMECSSSGPNIDTENAEIIKMIMINEAEGIFVLKKGIATISWTHDNRLFVISTQLDEEETMKIAKNVIYIK